MIKPNTILENPITLTAYGAANEVGRSAFIIEDGEHVILLEAGIKIQPKDTPSLAPEGLKERAKDITSIVLSHAHVDHSGYIPAIYQNGYTGKTYMTEPTRDITLLLWQDSLKIDGRHWTEYSMETAYNNIVTGKYREVIEIEKDITIEFFSSGHILGAAMILINWKGFKILYTGDINDQQTPLFEGFEIPDEKVDVLLTESTNGIRQVTNRGNVNADLVQSIVETLKGGNKVIIPCFAIGRSQEVLCVISEHIKNYPIYIDGMINKMNAITELYLHKDWVDAPILDRLRREKAVSPFTYKNMIPITKENFDNTHQFRKELARRNEPCIIVTTSGMMEPSPLHTHLRFAGKKRNNLIAVTGYQAEGTTGRDVVNGKRTIKLSVSRNKLIDVEIKSVVKKFGFSGHTSTEGIEELIDAVEPKQIYLVHGDATNISESSARLTNGIVPKGLLPRKLITLKP